LPLGDDQLAHAIGQRSADFRVPRQQHDTVLNDIDGPDRGNRVTLRQKIEESVEVVVRGAGEGYLSRGLLTGLPAALARSAANTSAAS